MNDPHLWKKYKQVALSNGVCHGTYVSRVKKQGMTPEEAATTPITNHREKMISQLRNGTLKAAPNKEGVRKYET